MFDPLLPQRSAADAAREFGDDDAGERHVGEVGGMAGDALFGLLGCAVYEDLWGEYVRLGFAPPATYPRPKRAELMEEDVPACGR